MGTEYRYVPDYAVSPGATLRDILEERGMSQADLSIRAGMTEKTVSQIVNGFAPISYDTAEKFEFVLGVPARFWNQRELTYREAIAKTEATERLAADTAWLKDIPVKELKERRRIDPELEGVDLVRAALMFFGVSSVEAWQETWGNPAAQYRGKASQEKRPGFVVAWLRLGELQAEGVECAPFDGAGFKSALGNARKLTAMPAAEWLKQLPAICAAVGVAVVFTKEIAGASVSGATRWLTKDKALIQLSLKYKSDDQIWFTFFHEAGHVILHGKKQVFVEFGADDSTADEREANEFARNLLIPQSVAHRLPYLKTRAQITAFADSIGISPGIVVGRLQRDKLAYPSAFNDLKRKFQWVPQDVA